MHPRTLRALAFALLLATAASAQQHSVVVSPVADMHRAPSIDSDVVSQAIFSTEVTALETKRGWIRIHTPDDYTGWVSRDDLRKQRDSVPGKIGRVSSLFASVYREANVETHRPVITVPFESQLTVTGETQNEDGRWFLVDLPGGTRGYVQSGDLAFDNAPLTIDQSISLAQRFLGLPYRWGGTSSFGFDCSGFTQMLMRSRGVSMPRDTRPQAKWEGVAAVERDALQPGDLLFFGKSADRINHTGYYIGEGRFIHATRYERPVVQISRLDDEPWTARLVASRRIR